MAPKPQRREPVPAGSTGRYSLRERTPLNYAYTPSIAAQKVKTSAKSGTTRGRGKVSKPAGPTRKWKSAGSAAVKSKTPTKTKSTPSKSAKKFVSTPAKKLSAPAKTKLSTPARETVSTSEIEPVSISTSNPMSASAAKHALTSAVRPMSIPAINPVLASASRPVSTPTAKPGLTPAKPAWTPTAAELIVFQSAHQLSLAADNLWQANSSADVATGYANFMSAVTKLNQDLRLLKGSVPPYVSKIRAAAMAALTAAQKHYKDPPRPAPAQVPRNSQTPSRTPRTPYNVGINTGTPQMRGASNFRAMSAAESQQFLKNMQKQFQIHFHASGDVRFESAFVPGGVAFRSTNRDGSSITFAAPGALMRQSPLVQKTGKA